MIDVEDVTLLWLKGWLPADWKPFTQKPDQVPDHYILIDRTGGPREAMSLDRAEILIETYHKTDRRAAKEMALQIGNRIKELELVHNVQGATVNSTVRLDDTLTKYWRYQVYCDINYRM